MLAPWPANSPREALPLGAAGVWDGQTKHAEGAVARAGGVGRAGRGARTHIIYDSLIFFIGPGSYMISRYT